MSYLFDSPALNLGACNSALEGSTIVKSRIGDYCTNPDLYKSCEMWHGNVAMSIPRDWRMSEAYVFHLQRGKTGRGSSVSRIWGKQLMVKSLI